MIKRIFKLVLTSLFQMVLSFGSNAQTHLPDSPKYLIPLIQKSKPDTNKVALLNKLGGYYIFKPGNFKYDLDSALNCLNLALILSKNLHSVKWTNETLKLKGNCYLERDDILNGDNCFQQVTNYFHSIGDYKQEMETWVRFGQCFTIGHSADQEKCYVRAISLFKLLPVHNRGFEIGVLKSLADAHLNEGKLDLAESELLQVLSEYHAINYKKLQETYDLLGEVYGLKGYPNKQLSCFLQCVKSMSISGDSTLAIYFYYKLGLAYQKIGFNAKSIIYFNKSLAQPIDPAVFYEMYYHILALCAKVNSLIDSGKGKEALKVMQSASQKIQPKDSMQIAKIENGFASCYMALRQYSKAERYFLNVEKIYNLLGSNIAPKIQVTDILICDLYVAMNRYDKAAVYLAKVGSIPYGRLSAERLGHIQLLYFKIDSAKGNYFTAIKHFQLYKTLNDSIFNATKNKQVQELEISYETAEKERSIAGLQSREKVQRAELKRINVQRNLTSGGIVLVLIIAGLTYKGFRQKRRSNLSLQAHQKEIDHKNDSLEKLNYKQQLLLIEKEWLLREIHHRVKNNLQTTISLLHMQSVYLSNEAALNAIRNSQRRMQAMSLIHQKLYQSENMTNIDMASYIAELTGYLKDSFCGSGYISFELQLERLELDVSQAIPLGLIINEAVTNAIKYAFPDKRNGKILIVLKADADGHCFLEIADNGIGLPAAFDADVRHNSLGLNLIHGLADQLNGELNIKNDNGTILIITFKDNGVFKEEEFENVIQQH